MPETPSQQALARQKASFELAEMPMHLRTEAELWQGRKLGQLPKAERREVMRRAVGTIAQEFSGSGITVSMIEPDAEHN